MCVQSRQYGFDEILGYPRENKLTELEKATSALAVNSAQRKIQNESRRVANNIESVAGEN